MSYILVTGGAGFIGSHMMKKLELEGYQAVAFDNLSTGHSDAVRYGQLVIGDLSHKDDLRELFKRFSFEAVIHFAASADVLESQRNPQKYFENNLVNSLNLIHAMLGAGVKKLIFSSTAAIYGIPTREKVLESDPISPINNYGKTKAMVEQVLDIYRETYKFSSISLRYFNAAGADFGAELGERHYPETHLIPRLCMAAAGLIDEVSIFGVNYDTHDGTCIRDYVHVDDLCDAHLAALLRLEDGFLGGSYNLGSGIGYSVKSVIESVKRVAETDFAVAVLDRRSGDPERLVADTTAALTDLNWVPKVRDLDDIVRSTWNYLQKQRLVSN